jgi:hypothetical protein
MAPTISYALIVTSRPETQKARRGKAGFLCRQVVARAPDHMCSRSAREHRHHFCA